VRHSYLIDSDVLPLVLQLRCRDVAEGVAKGHQRFDRGPPITRPIPSGDWVLPEKRTVLQHPRRP
jgi:hypothetical protein